MITGTQSQLHRKVMTDDNLRSNYVAANQRQDATTQNSDSFVPSSSSLSFNAYPFECTSDLLQKDSEVVYMPLTPTNVPLSFASTSGNVVLPSSSMSTKSQNPVCHGVFIPCSTGEMLTTADTQTDSFCFRSMDSNCRFDSKNDTTDQNLPKENDTDSNLGMLILQHLIALQNAVQPSSSLPADENCSPDHTVKTPGMHCSGEQTAPLVSNFSDLSPFLIPVEATFMNDPGFSLHVTPREEFTQTDFSPELSGLTLNCPTNELVLYPCCKSTVENVHNRDFNGSDSQAYTLSHLKEHIRRGSLDAPCEQHNKLVDTIKGCTKPGFVLLSVRREKVIPEDQSTVDVAIQPLTSDIHHTNTLTQESVIRKERRCSASQAPKKNSRRKQRVSRYDVEPRRRSLKKNSRLPLIALQTLEISEERVHHSSASTSTSRFRVSRFADKKQAWMAPAGSGCFVVHDLWTTKLPDYVTCNMNHSSIQHVLDSLKTKSEIAHADIVNAECIVCQHHQPVMPCECGKVTTT